MTIDIFGTTMSSWQVLASLGVLFIILEVFVASFVMLPIGTALLLTALFAPFVHDWVIIGAILAVNLIFIFAIFQKWIWTFLKTNRYKTNVDSMVGKKATVIEKIDKNSSGYIKLYGDQWAAKCNDGQEIPVGSTVVILSLEGNKVFVEKV